MSEINNSEIEVGAVEEEAAMPILKFQKKEPMDFSNEKNSVAMLHHRLKENLVPWRTINLDQQKVSWDEQALKLAELKEDYVQRRKLLAATIKKFKSKFLIESEEDEFSLEELKAAASDVISNFKTEYDQLSIFARFSESAFILTYKTFRDALDPVTVLDDGIALCIAVQDSIDDITKLCASLSQSHDDSQQVLKGDKETDAEQIAEYENRLHLEVTSMRERFEIELRNREHEIRNKFEREQLDLQQSFEDSFSRKDSEIASLLNSLRS